MLYYGGEARMELSGEPGAGSRTDLWIPLSPLRGEGGSYGI